MPAALHASGLNLALGAQPVLAGAELAVDPGQCVGLVGPNGAGKSTLLRVLAGAVRPDGGTVQLLPATAAVGYLPQEPERNDEVVEAYLARRAGVAAATAALDAATAALAAGEAGADDRYSDALDRWLALGAADFDARVGEVWAELGLRPALLGQTMRSLSGGEAARAGLAALLLSRFDVYLLDEPTNDLDLDGLARLERFVTGLAAPCVVVSHDRTFLQRTVSHVVELDEFSHGTARYAGGWDTYLRERDVSRHHAEEAYERYETKRDTLARRAQREREWATQGAAKAARRPDDNDKHVRRFRMNQTEQLAARRARTERAMERLEKVDQPYDGWELRLTIATAPRGGAVVARLVGATVARGGFNLGPVDVQIDHGERVVIEGPNGAGKSTLLRALLGEEPMVAGEHWRGPGVVVGRLDQARRQLAEAPDVLAGFVDATGLATGEARTLLAKFGIGADHVGRPADSLSPGERTRAELALLMGKGSNCLVLDEPTNHLDLPAIEQLESALEGFTGTVLLVSHDRSLLANVRRTRTLELRDGRLVRDEPA